MVGFSTVGFALSVVVVLEFDSACWAVCDAHLLCSGEYLFSELFVFLGACSAHRVFLFCVVWCCCVVLGGGASQRQRDERLHLTLLSTLSFFSSSLLVFLCVWDGVCCVARAQLCEHVRNTTHALCVLWVCLPCVACVTPCHNIVFVVPTTHCSLLTITMLTIEH